MSTWDRWSHDRPDASSSRQTIKKVLSGSRGMNRVRKMQEGSWESLDVTDPEGNSREANAGVRGDASFVPRLTGYYQHDDRFREENSEREEEMSCVGWDADKKWSHDLFDPLEQAPKSTEELVDYYGYDIRTGSGRTRSRELRLAHSSTGSDNWQHKSDRYATAKKGLYKPLRLSNGNNKNPPLSKEEKIDFSKRSKEMNNNLLKESKEKVFDNCMKTKKKVKFQNNSPDESTNSSDSVMRIAENLCRLDLGNNTVINKEKDVIQTQFFHNSDLKEEPSACSSSQVALSSQVHMKEDPNTLFLPSSHYETNNNLVLNTNDSCLHLGSPVELSSTRRTLRDKNDYSDEEEGALVVYTEAGGGGLEEYERGAHLRLYGSFPDPPDISSAHLVPNILQAHCLNNLLLHSALPSHTYAYPQVGGDINGLNNSLVYTWRDAEWEQYPAVQPLARQVVLPTHCAAQPCFYHQFPISLMSCRSGAGGYLSDETVLKEVVGSLHHTGLSTGGSQRSCRSGKAHYLPAVDYSVKKETSLPLGRTGEALFGITNQFPPHFLF